MKVCTIDVEIFAGLNICGFNPIEVFVEILSHCLGHKCLFSMIREVLIHGKTFTVVLKTIKTGKISPANPSMFMVSAVIAIFR